jgi:beta-lactamase class A
MKNDGALEGGNARLSWLKNNWKKVLGIAVGLALILLVILQFLYPWDRLPLYASIGSVNVGGKSTKEVIKEIDELYAGQSLSLYFGDNKKPQKTIKPAALGLTIRSEKQVESRAYSWWLRLVPTSLWWAHAVGGESAPTYERSQTKIEEFVSKELGESCDVKPINATLAYKDKKLDVVHAVPGGTCRPDDVIKILGSVQPTITNSSIRIPMTPRPVTIDDNAAQSLADQLLEKTKNVSITTTNGSVNIEQETLLSWLDFGEVDGRLVGTVNADRSSDFFTKQLAPKVAVAAGVTKITTYDFTEVSRVNGNAGLAMDYSKTVQQMNAWLDNKEEKPAIQLTIVPPTKTYTRTYSPTDVGITALITQFAEGRSGVFGVSFAELDGLGRRAAYQENRIFQTASTYKLFVAYGTLKRIESGQWSWSDQVVGGRDIAKCFDDMIVLSDNPCAKTLLERLGYGQLTNELKSIGLTKSTFIASYIQTTAQDLTTFLGALYSGQLLSPGSTQTLISAMQRNVYRKGIPAGTGVPVADKVGFLFGLLHDAAIVYSPKGTYVLTILTDGSSWGTIADLARQIESLRT